MGKLNKNYPVEKVFLDGEPWKVTPSSNDIVWGKYELHNDVIGTLYGSAVANVSINTSSYSINLEFPNNPSTLSGALISNSDVLTSDVLAKWLDGIKLYSASNTELTFTELDGNLTTMYNGVRRYAHVSVATSQAGRENWLYLAVYSDSTFSSTFNLFSSSYTSGKTITTTHSFEVTSLSKQLVGYVTDESNDAYPNYAMHEDGYYYAKFSFIDNAQHTVYPVVTPKIGCSEFVGRYHPTNIQNMSAPYNFSYGSGQTESLYSACYLRKNLWVFMCSNSAIAAESRNNQLRYGVPLSTGSTGTKTPILVDKYGDGAIVGVSGKLYYLRVDLNLEITLNDLGVTYTSGNYPSTCSMYFVNPNLIVMRNYATVRTYSIDRNTLSATSISTGSIPSTITGYDSSGASEQLDDHTLLLDYSGGNAKSWYVSIARISDLGEVTVSESTLIASITSGYRYTQNLAFLKFRNKNFLIYAPAPGSNLYKLSVDSSGNLNSTQMSSKMFSDSEAFSAHGGVTTTLSDTQVVVTPMHGEYSSGYYNFALNHGLGTLSNDETTITWEVHTSDMTSAHGTYELGAVASNGYMSYLVCQAGIFESPEIVGIGAPRENLGLAGVSLSDGECGDYVDVLTS